MSYEPAYLAQAAGFGLLIFAGIIHITRDLANWSMVAVAQILARLRGGNGRQRGGPCERAVDDRSSLTISVDNGFVDLICRKVVPAKIRNGEIAEDVVEDRRRAFDFFVSLDLAGRLKARAGECVHEFLQRNAVLEPERHGDREVVHERPEGRALLVHVDEKALSRRVVVAVRPVVE